MPHSQTIRCVNKGYGRLPHERILNVGGINEDGSRWKQSQKQTIKEIEDGAWEYHSQLTWRRERIVVATYLGQAVGWYEPGQGAGFIGAIVGAIILLAIWGFIARRSSSF